MIRRFSVFVLSMAYAAPAVAQGASSPAGYCYSDLSATTVYLGAVGPVPSADINTSQMTLEFHQYLKARYGFTTNSNYPVSCGVRESVALAEGDRARVEGQMRGQQKQVVEAEWKYVASASAAALHSASGTHAMVAATPVPQPDHGVCFSEVFPGPLYVSDFFDAVPPVSIAQWNMALMKFLTAKYGYKGSVECLMVTLDNAQGLAKAREGGARAASRSVVETGWKYDAAASTAPAPHVDEDREPAHPAAAAGASADARKLANQEGPAVLAYCLKDPTLSVVFDCAKIRHAVLTYRLAHTGTPEPLTSLFTGDKLDCTECLSSAKPGSWARRTALAHGMKGPAATCVSQHFVTTLRSKPYPNRVQQDYDAAVAACKG